MATTRTSARPRAVLAAVVVAALVVAACSEDPDKTAGTTSTTERRRSTTTTTTTKPTTTTTTEPKVDVEGDTRKGAEMVEPHRAEYRGGKLYLEGAVPSRKVGDELKARAAEVIGAANVIDHYIIDPAAPPITDGRVIVDEPFLFQTGSAVIDAGYDALLNLGVIVMQLNPQVVMVVRGHTDADGDEQMNLRLSLARAQAVADWIIAKGIDRSRFQLEGKGESEPVGDNATSEGRALNRRIEVELTNLLA